MHFLYFNDMNQIELDILQFDCPKYCLPNKKPNNHNDATP